MKKKHKKSIKHVIKNFDFEYIFNMMEKMDWQWATSDSDGRTVFAVPSIEQMKISAKYHLGVAVYGLYDNQGYADFTSSSGGFYAYATRDAGGEIYLRLSFELCDSDSYDYMQQRKEKKNAKAVQ